MKLSREYKSVTLLLVAGLASIANAQVTQEPIAATLRYEVALPGGEWGSNVTIQPGDRVEWRIIVSYTGTQNAVALGRIYYQPIFSNVDNTGTGSEQDQLGTWRNNGVSGQGNTTLQQGLLSLAEGADSSELASYGRVHYGFTSRSTTAGSSGGLTAHRHSGGSSGPPTGEWMRIAGNNNSSWYPYVQIPTISTPILWGVVSDNNASFSTWFAPGTQNLTIFRQAFVASSEALDSESRTVQVTSEPATLQWGSGTDAWTRFMTWAAPTEGGSNATIRCGVEYIPATITIVPTPATTLVVVSVLLSSQRRRKLCVQ